MLTDWLYECDARVMFALSAATYGSHHHHHHSLSVMNKSAQRGATSIILYKTAQTTMIILCLLHVRLSCSSTLSSSFTGRSNKIQVHDRATGCRTALQLCINHLVPGLVALM